MIEHFPFPIREACASVFGARLLVTTFDSGCLINISGAPGPILGLFYIFRSYDQDNMFSEPCTPGHFLDDSFSETKPPAFDPGKSGLSEASAIQAKLNRRLGPEYVSQRPSPGGGPKLTYVEGWKIIGLANEVFGYNGWCSTVTRIETDFIDIDPESRRCSVGITAVVKVTLKDGTYHEDIGYGTGENLKSKGAALDKVRHSNFWGTGRS